MLWYFAFGGFVLFQQHNIKIITAIENTVAPKFVEMNKKAFDLGFNS